MEWRFFDDVTVGSVPTIVRCADKIPSSELKIRKHGKTSFAWGSWKE